MNSLKLSNISEPLETINSLPFAEEIKDNFRLIYVYTRGMLPQTKAFKKIIKNLSLYSGWAFILVWFYYFYMGIWKKGLIFLGILGSLFALLFIICSFSGLVGDVIAFLSWIVCSLAIRIYISAHAYYDLYRKYVFHENFWW